jgi:hypothetical protein
MPQVVDLRKIKKVLKKTPEKGEIEPVKKIKHIEVETKEIKTKIEWTALEFKKYKKGKKWFVSSALFALAVIIAAILLKNLLLVIATILTVFVVYIYAKKEPRKIKFSISGNGVQIDQTVYKFEDLKSFWIFYEPPEVKEISLRSKKAFMPYIKIPLSDQNPAEVRGLLLKFLPEKQQRESIIDGWTRKSGF